MLLANIGVIQLFLNHEVERHQQLFQIPSLGLKSFEGGNGCFDGRQRLVRRLKSYSILPRLGWCKFVTGERLELRQRSIQRFRLRPCPVNHDELAWPLIGMELFQNDCIGRGKKQPCVTSDLQRFVSDCLFGSKNQTRFRQRTMDHARGVKWVISFADMLNDQEVSAVVDRGDCRTVAKRFRPEASRATGLGRTFDRST